MTRKAVDGTLFTIGLVAVAAIVQSSDNCEKYQNTRLFLTHFWGLSPGVALTGTVGPHAMRGLSPK